MKLKRKNVKVFFEGKLLTFKYSINIARVIRRKKQRAPILPKERNPKTTKMIHHERVIFETFLRVLFCRNILLRAKTRRVTRVSAVIIETATKLNPLKSLWFKEQPRLCTGPPESQRVLKVFMFACCQKAVALFN